MKKILQLLIVVGFISIQSFSQSFEETMKNLGEEVGKKYAEPVVTAFGANLNGGWFHKAPQSKIFGIDLEIGAVAMGTFMADANKNFSLQSNFKFSGGPVGSNSEAEKLARSTSFYTNASTTQKQALIDAISSTTFLVNITAPTIMGSKSDTMKIVVPQTNVPVAGAPGGNVTIPAQTTKDERVVGILDGLSMIPLAAPQVSIGTLYGTQATFRFLPEIEINKDLGKFKYFGFGLQHNLGMWLPIPVVDVSVSFFTQKLNVGSIMEAKTTSFGLNASKQFGFAFLNVTPYAGFMMESAKMTFGYDFPTYTDPNNSANNKVEHISFDIEGENKSRLTVGLGFRLGIININADYNLGKQNSATAGVFLAF